MGSLIAEPRPAGETVDHSRSIARNTSLQTGAHVVGLALSIGSAALVTRYLGVGGYGTFSLLAVLLTLPVTVLNGSLDTLAVRRLSVDGKVDRTFFSNVLALKLTVAVAFACVATAIAWLAPLSFAIRLAVAAFSIALIASAIQGTLLTVEQARQRFHLPVLVDVGTRFFTFLGIGVLVLAPHPGAAAPRVALCVGASAVATIIWLTFSIVRRRRRVPLGLSHDPEIWRRLGRASGQLALINLLGLLNYRLDIVVLAVLADTHAVGIYAVATRFIDALLPLAAFFVAACFPVLASTAVHAPQQRHGQVQRAAEFLALASVPIAVGGWVFAPQLVRLVAGTDYHAAVLPLRLLLLSLPFSYLSTFLLFLVIAADKQRRVLWLMGASITLNLVLNVALVPFYGAVGPAVATLVSEVLGTAALLVIVRRTLGIHVMPRPVLKTLAAGGAMCAAAVMLQPVDAVLAFGVSAVVYTAAVFALRAVRPLDLKLLVGRAT
jgi:O-antigen/teichoic acid export membrane protein